MTCFQSEEDGITFLYELRDGTSKDSYGLNVASLAHLPASVLERAARVSEKTRILIDPNVCLVRAVSRALATGDLGPIVRHDVLRMSEMVAQ